VLQYYLEWSTVATTTIWRLSGFCPELPGWAGTRINTHQLTPILIINYPLSASSICCDPWHAPCSIYAPDSLFAQPLSKFSLVYLLVWHPPLHTPYISSSNHCLPFEAHVYTIATCFVVVPVPRLYHLILVSLSTFTWNSIFYINATHPSDLSHLCPLKCHLIFFSHRPDLTSMQHTTLHTTAVQSISQYQW